MAYSLTKDRVHNDRHDYQVEYKLFSFVSHYIKRHLINRLHTKNDSDSIKNKQVFVLALMALYFGVGYCFSIIFYKPYVRMAHAFDLKNPVDGVYLFLR